MLGTTPTTSSADISKRPLNVTATEDSREEQDDGNTSATGQTVTTDRIVISGTPDDVTVSFTALFADRNAGIGKTVNLSAFAISGGTDQNNYMLGTTPTTSSAVISKRPLNVTATANSANKQYDGNTSATGRSEERRVGEESGTRGEGA